MSRAQRRLLLYIAVHGGVELLSESRRILGGLGSASTVQTAVAALEKKEVLVNENRQWKFVNPAFELWIRDRVAVRK